MTHEARPRAEPAAAARTPLRVLILEDRPEDAELELDALRRGGFDPVWERFDSEAGLLAGLAAGPDVILCDYAMPQFDARRVLELLAERRVDVPLIIVSGTIGAGFLGQAVGVIPVLAAQGAGYLIAGAPVLVALRGRVAADQPARAALAA